jgi:glycine oxidase
VVVVAAGAWSAGIDGLPRELPVVPLKGQMLSLESSVLRHPVMGDDVYLVPRRSELAVGATAEHAGFDTTVSPDAIERLRQSAIAICPSLADAPVVRTWAGIRPATPDMLPILGRDPDSPSLIYACGHSKNGILLAPASATCLAALATGAAPPFVINPFSVRRF